jgi:hypothetical protein
MSIATRITVDEYDRMIAEGAFESEMSRPRLELIDGEILPMSPIGPLHEDLVDVPFASGFRTPLEYLLWRVLLSLMLPGSSAGATARVGHCPTLSWELSRWRIRVSSTTADERRECSLPRVSSTTGSSISPAGTWKSFEIP